MLDGGEPGALLDKSRLFLEFTLDGIDELRREILERSVPSQNAWWGDVIRITDPTEGNALLSQLY